MSFFDENNEINIYDGVPEEMIAKHKEWVSLYDRISNNLVAKGLPFQAVFEITPLCNLKCKMCFIRLEKEKMDSIGEPLTAEQWKDITQQAVDMGTYAILITGGEPFVHPEFIEIYENIVRSGFRVLLFTNAVMLTEKILGTLKKYPPNYLYITVYGASEETYEKVSGNGKAYYSVINNIKILKNELKDTLIELRTTVIKDNIDDVPIIKELAAKMEMQFSYGLGLLKPVRGACNEIEKSRLSPEEIVKMKKKYLELSKDSKIYDSGLKNMEIFEDNMLKYDGSKIEVTEKMKEYYCTAAYKIYTITWDGKMIPCQTFKEPYTLPLNEGLKSAWDKLRKYKNEIIIPARCIKCKYRYYCGKCPAAVQSESGTFFDNEPYECMQTMQTKNNL